MFCHGSTNDPTVPGRYANLNVGFITESSKFDRPAVILNPISEVDENGKRLDIEIWIPVEEAETVARLIISRAKSLKGT